MTIDLLSQHVHDVRDVQQICKNRLRLPTKSYLVFLVMSESDQSTKSIFLIKIGPRVLHLTAHLVI